jgi:hypothetical protein
MAKSKNLTVKDIRAHLFISIIGSNVELFYHDDYENGAGLGAAITSLLEEDDKLFDIFSAALITAIESKEKHSSKTAKKPVKTPTKAVNKK